MRRLVAFLALAAAVWIPGFGRPVAGLRASGPANADGWFRWEGTVRPDRDAKGRDAGTGAEAVPIVVSVNLATGEVEIDAEPAFDADSARIESRWEEQVDLRREGAGPTLSGRIEGERTGIAIAEAEGRAAGRSTTLLVAKGPARHGQACKLGVRVRAEIVLRFRVGGTPYTVRILGTGLRSNQPRVAVADGG
jgi:hypothetical protein